MIPIIGQPVVSDFFLTIQIVCPCKTNLLLVGSVGAVRACTNPDCDKVYRLSGWPIVGADGELQWPLGVGRSPKK